MIFAPVEEVKIYRNSAVVRRKTTIGLKQGTNEILLFGLGRFADIDSLRLFFSEGVIGKDVQLVPFTETGHLLSEDLQAEITELKSKMQTLKKMEELWLSNGNFETRGDCSVETIERYIEALPAHLEKLRAEQRKLEQQLEALREKKELQETKETFQIIKMILQTDEDMEAVCEFEYLDSAAQWQSSYEIHADSDSSAISVVSRAAISQTTGEDWKNVRVLLCTGSPTVQQEIPTLKKLELRFRSEYPKPIPPRPMPPAFSAPMMEDVSETTVLSAPGRSGKTIRPAAPKPMVMEAVEETEMETVAIYHLPGRRTISSGMQRTMADIKTDSVPAELCIVCVPKLDDNAYLAAAIKSENWTLKPSHAKIYLNNTYCGEAYIAPNPAEEETFMISLGKDERISLAYEVTTSKTEHLMFRGQKRKITEHAIRISNKTDKPHKVLVWDQIPVSTEKQILIDSISADGAVIDDNSGKLSWSLTIDGKTMVEKRVSYTVSYPKGKVLSEIYTRPIKGLRICTHCGALAEGLFCPKCGNRLE